MDRYRYIDRLTDRYIDWLIICWYSGDEWEQGWVYSESYRVEVYK